MTGKDRENGTAALDTTLQQAENHPVSLRADAVADRMPKAFHGQIQRVMDGDGPLKAVEAMLEQLSEGRYLSPRDLDEKLRGIPGVDASLPEDEIRRLEILLPRELSPEMIRKVQLLQETTEGNTPPLIQQIPATFVVDGVERDFTLANFLDIWDRARLSDDNPDGTFESNCIDEKVKVGKYMLTKPRWTRSNMIGADLVDEHVTEETKNRVWHDGKLRAYTPRSIIGSNGKTHFNQVQYQREFVGEGSEIDASVFLALPFRNLVTGQKIVLADGEYQGMRLNESTSEGPYFVALHDLECLYIDDSFGGYASAHGIGASFEIS